MKQFLSQSELNEVLRKEVKLKGKDTVAKQSHAQRATNAPDASTHTIFLSHSHLDKTIVDKITVLFNKLSIGIYVDWQDTHLPASPDADTAKNIRNKIQKCKHFLFLATYHGLRSKWCNWELGVADTIKGENRLAVLPIQSKSGNWRGNEYLQLYSEMKFDVDNLESISSDKVFIHHTNGRIIDLVDWLQT